MTTDRLAALLHEEMCGSGFPTVHTTHMGDGRVVNACEWTAARLAAAGVTVGLDVERLAAALRSSGLVVPALSVEGVAAAIAREYGAAQPAPDLRAALGEHGSPCGMSDCSTCYPKTAVFWEEQP